MIDTVVRIPELRQMLFGPEERARLGPVCAKWSDWLVADQRATYRGVEFEASGPLTFHQNWDAWGADWRTFTWSLRDGAESVAEGSGRWTHPPQLVQDAAGCYVIEYREGGAKIGAWVNRVADFEEIGLLKQLFALFTNDR